MRGFLLAPSWAEGVVRDGEMGKTAPKEAIGCIINPAQDGKTEILDNIGIRR
jgi:hypothetical protein